MDGNFKNNEVTNEEILDIIETCSNAYKEFPKFIRVFNKLKEMVLSKQETYCEWIKYDYRTMCPREHDIDNPYWRIPESRMDALKYCPYCSKEIKLID